MAERTSEQILDEVLYAIQCCAYHYGPAFSEEGLLHLRKLLQDFNGWRTDATFRVDQIEGDKYVDFHERIIWPQGWWKIDFPLEIKE